MSLRKKVNKIKNKLLLEYYNKKNYKLIFPPQGLGDILVLLLGLEKYREKYPNKKIGVIVTKKHFYDLCKMFIKNIDKIIYIPETYKLPNYVLDIGKKIYGPNSHFDKFEDAILETIEITGTLDSFNVPKIKESKNILELFESKYKKGKTILITPEATTSQNCFEDDYWLKVANKLRAKGYNPVFNSNEKYDIFDNIFLNLEDTITFANLAGNVLGFRSGLNDIIGCFSSAYQVIIYPNNWKKGDMPYLNGFDDNPNEKYMQDGSLNRLYPNKNIKEFIYNEEIDVAEYFKGV